MLWHVIVEMGHDGLSDLSSEWQCVSFEVRREMKPYKVFVKTSGPVLRETRTVLHADEPNSYQLRSYQKIASSNALPADRGRLKAC